MVKNGTYGRLKYSARDKARGVADKLDLAGIHRHDDRDPDGDGMNETIYMPGENHRNLNDALRERGKEPTMVPGADDMGGGMDSEPGTMMDMMGVSEQPGTGTRDDQLMRDDSDMGSDAGFLVDTESVFGEGEDGEMDIY